MTIAMHDMKRLSILAIAAGGTGAGACITAIIIVLVAVFRDGISSFINKDIVEQLGFATETHRSSSWTQPSPHILLHSKKQRK